MGITVNTNIYSLAARRNIGRAQSDLATSVRRLSSGLRVNMAKDGAADLGIGQLAEAHARGAAAAQKTLGDGFSRLQIVDGVLQTANQITQRIYELSVMQTSATYTSEQKGYMSTEISSLDTELQALAGRAKFNNEDAWGSFTVLAGSSTSDTISVGVSKPTLTATTASAALTLIGTINTALATIGAGESVLEKALTTAMNLEEAQWATYGRAMDADMAAETARLTSAQVVQQAGVAALAQANTLPQLALGLLG